MTGVQTCALPIYAGGKTVAVLAHGLDRLYPARHLKLAQAIVAQGGALVSEYPKGTPPLQYRFVERNRLIAAMAEITIVTEADVRIVWEPPWNQAMISETGKMELGLV